MHVAGCMTETQADRMGHGTMIAAIVGAKNNSGGFRGVAPNAKIFSVRIFNRKVPANVAEVGLKALSTIEGSLAAGDVINISWGSYFNPLKQANGDDSFELQLESKLRALADRAIWIVVAAGNKNSGETSGYVQTISPARSGAYRRVEEEEGLSQFLLWKVVTLVAPGKTIFGDFLHSATETCPDPILMRKLALLTTCAGS